MPPSEVMAMLSVSVPPIALRRRSAAFRLILAASLAAAGVLALAAGDRGIQAQDRAPLVSVVELDSAIDKVSERFLSRALDKAADEEAELVVIMIDTPGGLLDSTRQMVRDILLSPVPVVAYVAPTGARAASAGTFIGAAAAVLAMAPATNIGAASVVSGDGSDLPDTLQRKANEDAAALLRDIAGQRGRNVEALERTVFQATSYSSTEAVENGIADLIAADIDDLLEQLDGRTLTANGVDVVVDTQGARISRTDMSVFEKILSFLSNPNIAFLLISLGSLGIIVELWNPGLFVPGTVGVAFLILGFAGVGQLDFHWAGVALIALAIFLFILEATAPGVSYFGVAGVVSLVLGGIFLVGFFGTPALEGPNARVSRWLLGVIAGSVGLFAVWFGYQIRAARRLPAYVSPTAAGALVGQVGIVTAELHPEGQVRVAGEEWTAELESGGVLAEGEQVTVSSVEDIHLRVTPGETKATPQAETAEDTT